MILKKTLILGFCTLALACMAYGTYVYADKYAWTQLSISPIDYASDWQSVAIPSSGQYRYAGRYGNVYMTSNAGDSWTQVLSLGEGYDITSISTSETGQYVLVAVRNNVSGNGTVYTSSNYGSNFSGSNVTERAYISTAMDLSGQFQYVGAVDQTLLRSNNYGASWSNSSFTSYIPRSIATSDDGVYVYVATDSDIRNSGDSGVNFPSGTGEALGYVDVATSADGSIVVAAPFTGTLRRSTDYGSTYQELFAAGSRSWKSVAISDNGIKIVAVTTSAGVWASSDGGHTFAEEGNPSSGLWNDVAFNADGTIVFLASSNAYLRSGSLESDAPTVSITSPSNGSYASGTIDVVASASDTGISGLVGVQLYYGTNINIGSEDTSSPYSQSLDTTSLNDGSSYSLFAVARDDAGNYATSTSVSIIVDNTAPNTPTSLDLLTVTDLGGSSSDDITSTTTPRLSVGCQVITGSFVKFYHSTSTLMGTAACVSSTATTTSSALSDGIYSITAKQTDAAGNTSSSSVALSITIDSTSPSISFASPSASATVGGTIELTASASDATSGIAGVKFYNNTTMIGTEDTSSPFTVSWDTSAVSDGSKTLYAVARDVAGNLATSTITVTVSNAVTTTTTGPAGGLSGGGSQLPPQSQNLTTIDTIVVRSNTQQNSGTELPESKESSNQVLQSAGISDGFKFTKNATLQTTHNEVASIQKMLNVMGYRVSITGAGSKGQETNLFGQKTRLALVRFQVAFGLPGTGYFGPLSRSIMNRILQNIQR